MKSQLYWVAFAVLSLVACSNNSKHNVGTLDMAAAKPGNQVPPKQEEKQIEVSDTTGAGTEPVNTAVPSQNINADWDKKIIKTADIELKLDDYKKFNSTIHASLKQFGAYVAAEKQTENDLRIENSLTVKVPVDEFDALVNSFAGDGIKLMAKNVSTEDVTGEVVDTKARLQAKMAVRDKYLELLKQARNMTDILQVQNQINDIQENIEAANGRIQYLQHASAYSTINLSYYQYLNGRTADDLTPDFFTKMTRAFSTGTSFLIGLFLFCVSIWPFIIAGLIAWLYFKKLAIKKV